MMQTARAFVHQWRFQDGTLRVRTLLPGEDLYAEPPDALVARLRELAKAH